MAAMHTEDPFAPGGSPSRKEVERYLQGGSSAREAHAVEAAALRDPLLAEAMEGLAHPGALEGLRALDQHGPKGGRTWLWGAGIAGVALLIGIVLVTREEREPPASAHVTDTPSVMDAPAPAPAAHAVARGTDSLLGVLHAEIVHAQPIAMADPTKARSPERFIERDRSTVPYVEPRTTRLDHTAPAPAKPAPAHAVVHHLVFRHGLKLVHPDELYPRQQPTFTALGVPASMERWKAGTTEEVRYLDFMDEVLEQYAAGNTAGALDGLVFLLQQYPDDVNARFYTGQCCYHLGLTARARDQFTQVLASPVDAFDEETAWYAALSIEQVEGAAAARELFERIAGEGGFYAAQARAHVR